MAPLPAVTGVRALAHVVCIPPAPWGSRPLAGGSGVAALKTIGSLNRTRDATPVLEVGVRSAGVGVLVDAGVLDGVPSGPGLRVLRSADNRCCRCWSLSGDDSRLPNMLKV